MLYEYTPSDGPPSQSPCDDLLRPRSAQGTGLRDSSSLQPPVHDHDIRSYTENKCSDSPNHNSLGVSREQPQACKAIPYCYRCSSAALALFATLALICAIHEAASLISVSGNSGLTAYMMHGPGIRTPSTSTRRRRGKIPHNTGSPPPAGRSRDIRAMLSPCTRASRWTGIGRSDSVPAQGIASVPMLQIS